MKEVKIKVNGVEVKAPEIGLKLTIEPIKDFDTKTSQVIKDWFENKQNYETTKKAKEKTKKER